MNLVFKKFRLEVFRKVANLLISVYNERFIHILLYMGPNAVLSFTSGCNAALTYCGLVYLTD